MVIGNPNVAGGQTEMDMLSAIYRYLRRSGESRTGFGRKALNDPRFVWDLERGRIPNLRTERRVRAWLAQRETPRGGRREGQHEGAPR